MSAAVPVARAHAPADGPRPATRLSLALAGVDRLAVGTAVAAALSAFLLFLAQPLFARLALPVYGGGAGVWTAALVFAQVALVVGYGYAHLSAQLPLRRQVILHLGLLWALLGAPLLGLPPGHEPTEPVALDFLLVAAARLGPALVVLAGTGVLLQRWLAVARPARADWSYALYAAGSAGSLLGLLSFPFVLEPAMHLREQQLLWTGLYGALALLVTLCARPVLLAAERWVDGAARPIDKPAAPPADRRGLRAGMGWMVLAAAPCAAMVAVTSVLTTDLAAVPLLWVAPLAVYLTTYAAAFAPGRRLCLPAAPAAALVLPAVVATAGRLTGPLPLLVPVHLVALFAVALGCHTRLAARRPRAEHGSRFYVWVSAGGAVGGVLAGVAAPHLLESLGEYPIALVVSWLLGFVSLRGEGPRRALTDVLVALSVGTMTVVLMSRAGDGWALTGVVGTGILLAPGALACLTCAGRPLRFGLAAAALLAAAHLPPKPGTILYEDRAPYGMHRVRLVEGEAPTERYHVLLHGTTVHGVQRRGVASETEPLSYYHRGSGIAEVFAARRSGAVRGDVAVVGLGTGALACYGTAGERFTFFELDPAVVRIARDDRLFTYLRDCSGRADVVVGDGRLSLARAPARVYGLVVLDAYSSDAVPVHLLTREAVADFRRTLTPGGVLAFHISNRHVDLEPVLSALASELGWVCLVRSENPLDGPASGNTVGATSSKWAVMGDLGGEGGVIRRLAADRRWLAARTNPRVPAWSDGYAPVSQVVRWG